MRIYSLILCFILLFAFGCEEEEFEPATVIFYPTLNLSYLEGELTVNDYDTVYLETSRLMEENSQVRIQVTGNAQYGVNYRTYPPELTEGEVIVEIPAGASQGFFVFYPMNDNVIIGADYEVSYSITGGSGSIKSASESSFNVVIKDDDRDPADCFPTAATEVIVAHDFENCPGDFEIPDGFIEEFVEGAKSDRGWGCRPFGRTGQAVQASAFGGASGIDDSWLIMDPFNAELYSAVELSFFMESFFDGDGEVHVWYSNNYVGSGDPRAEGNVWFEMANVTEQLPAAGSRGFVEITTAPCLIEGESVYIAFQFVGGTNNNSSSWTIDDLVLSGSLK